MPDQNVGTRDTGFLQRHVQFTHVLQGVARCWARIAPAKAGAVEGNHACKLGDLWLYPAPIGRGASSAADQNHGWIAPILTHAREMNLVAADIDELAGRGKIALITGSSDNLVDSSGYA